MTKYQTLFLEDMGIDGVRLAFFMDAALRSTNLDGRRMLNVLGKLAEALATEGHAADAELLREGIAALAARYENLVRGHIRPFALRTQHGRRCAKPCYGRSFGSVRRSCNS